MVAIAYNTKADFVHSQLQLFEFSFVCIKNTYGVFLIDFKMITVIKRMHPHLNGSNNI